MNDLIPPRLTVSLFLFLSACGGKVDSFRDALAKDDSAGAVKVVDVPRCEKADYDAQGKSACLSAIGRAFGSKHDFSLSDPDQGDAAAVALVLVRERRGDFVPAPETWMLAMKIAKGPGADALRLAIASRLTELVPRFGKRVDDEAEAMRLAHDLGAAMPGSCATYALLGDGVDIGALAPEMSPDHAPCVQTDLERKNGPGAAFGFGAWRALAGAVSLLKDEARALREGADRSQDAAKDAFTKKVVAIEEAAARFDMKKVEAPGNAWAHPK
jgi:hypothetical protein